MMQHVFRAHGARAGAGARPRARAGVTGVLAVIAAIFAASPAARAQVRPGEVYRSFDGSGNNPNHPTWGAAGARYLRERSGAHYADGRGAPPGANRPGARALSNAFAAQGDIETADARGLSTCVYEFGQFLDHDFGIARGGTAEPMLIPVPPGDVYFDPLSTGTRTIGFTRSAYDTGTGVTSPRQQVNDVTAYIDLSQVYGSDAARAAWLREGAGGRLKVIHTPQGDMLPFNDGTLANDNPVGRPVTSLRAAGDVRANEQPGLTALHTIFVREHNWQAARLAGLHPAWDDERLYQEARRVVIAEMQVIVYKEFIPALLGHELPPYTGYRPDVNPGMSNAFATAAYRIGHSMVGPDIDILDADFNPVGVVLLETAFFNPDVIPAVGGVDPIARYMITSTEQAIDTMVVDPLRNFLFGPPGAGGFDLAALNIQRGRDHGLADYNTMRTDFGLLRVTSFGQITTNTRLAAALEALFGSVDNIDPWVGMLAEDHTPGASVGPTHAAVFTDQFRRLRDGDRFWYQRTFSSAEIAALEGTRLSTIFRRTTGLTRVQANVFFASGGAPTCHGACVADVDDGTGTGNPDGGVTLDDLLYFLGVYASGAPCADVDDGSGTGAPDGGVTVDDLTFYLARFSAGC